MLDCVSDFFALECAISTSFFLLTYERDYIERKRSDVIVYWKKYGFVWRAKGKLDVFFPDTIPGIHWYQWHTEEDLKVCFECQAYQGQIYSLDSKPKTEPPVHLNCRCTVELIPAIIAGNATKDGENGADYWLAHHGKLPDYYINKDALFALGWGNGKVPAKYAPGKMLGGDIYFDKEGHLPAKSGRIWYEADINYYEGKRNGHRLIYSNDGLLFVTYDHGKNFYEIIKGDPDGAKSYCDFGFYKMPVSPGALCGNGKTNGVG